MEVIKKLFEEDDGAAAVEYGLLIALIFVVIMGAVSAFGAALKRHFDYFGNHLPSG